MKCHHRQSGLVTDAVGHMTPRAPISDHADVSVPDGSDFPPCPSLQALSLTAAGTKQQGGEGVGVYPTGYTDAGR